MQELEGYTFTKCLGKGSFGEVYLTKKEGSSELFATKKMAKKMADEPSFKKYLTNEISILKEAIHENIVKFEDLKQTSTDYYLIMEYCNGGCLSDCLEKYQEIHGKPFPEEIVQYLMRQIVPAIKFLHSKKIIHRDLKLDNIMIKFFNEEDKKNLNLMKSQVKIIDFGFATKLIKANLAYSTLGSPLNMDPLILKKLNRKKGSKKLGYDEKADIWSLGTLCYEMLMGQTAFEADTMDELVKKIEKGSYKLPTSLSKEVVSFLNGMLQYDGSKRLSADDLSKHMFLTKNIQDFTHIDLDQVSNKVEGQNLNINIKRNKTIWSIFNEENENKLNNVSPLMAIDENAEYNQKNNNNPYNNNPYSNIQFDNDGNDIKRASTEKRYKNNMNNMNPNMNNNMNNPNSARGRSNSNQNFPFQNNMGFMPPHGPYNQPPYPGMNPPSYINQPPFPRMNQPPYPGNQQGPYNQQFMGGNMGNDFNSNQSNYSYRGGIYGNNNNNNNQRQESGYCFGTGIYN